jgi:hypothetical protein
VHPNVKMQIVHLIIVTIHVSNKEILIALTMGIIITHNDNNDHSNNNNNNNIEMKIINIVIIIIIAIIIITEMHRMIIGIFIITGSKITTIVTIINNVIINSGTNINLMKMKMIISKTGKTICKEIF